MSKKPVLKTKIQNFFVNNIHVLLKIISYLYYLYKHTQNKLAFIIFIITI